MNKESNILERVRELAPEARRRFGATSIGVFGSALDPTREPNDVDILVELERQTFRDYMGLKFYFEDELGKKVDLVMKDTIKPALKSKILGQVQYVS